MENKIFIHAIFQNIASQNPQATAIVEANSSINYEQLSNYSDKIAINLQSIGVNKGDVVGLYIESSINYVASMLAVSNVGGVFLPLEVSQPPKRLAQILNQVQPQFIVSTKENINQLNNYKAEEKLAFSKILILENAENEPTIFDAQTNTETKVNDAIFKTVELDGNDSCYLLYTSGSTGTPKIIEGRHKGLSHFIQWEIKEFGLNSGTKVSQFAPISFDVSLRDILSPLLSGGTLCIPEKNTKTQMPTLLKWFETVGITLSHMVPSLFRLLTQELSNHQSKYNLSNLKNILLAGEPLFGRDVLNWRKVVGENTELVNLYGPSETTLAKIFNRIGEVGEENEIMPLGNPLPNTAILILKANRLCRIGEVGEICIKTPYRSKGYYNDTEMTNEKFVQNPLHNDYEDIIYRTGDLGKYLQDRSIAYVGRQDNQLKINGNRVELFEVERVLASFGAFEQVVVNPIYNEQEISLVAYYRSDKNADEHAIKKYLTEHLPTYMHPAYYFKLDVFPLNINGKVDRRALPKPVLDVDIQYEEVSNEYEAKIEKMWQDILKVEKIGRKSSFFSIGGTSLKAIQIVSKIHKEFGVLLKLGDFFAKPTVAELAVMVVESKKIKEQNIEVLGIQDYYDVSHTQKRLWVLSHIEGENAAYNNVFSIFMDGDLNKPIFEKAINQLIERHEILRTTFIEIDGEPKQKISSPSEIDFSIENIDARNEQNVDEYLKAILNAESKSNFDLAEGPLLRMKFYQLSDTKHFFVFVMHHIISDGWSMQVLIKETIEVYNALNQNKTISQNPLKIQYKDFAAWQNKQLMSSEMTSHKFYWNNQFSDEIPVLQLPTDRPRPVLKTHNGAMINFLIDTDISSKIEAFGRSHEVSTFMLLMASLKSLFYRYTNQNDVVVGIPIAGREHSELANQIGFYVNTLAIRSKIDNKASFAEVLKNEKNQLQKAYEHQIYPFDKLVDDLNVIRDISRSPLFDVMINYLEKVTESNLRIDGINTVGYDSDIVQSKYDLEFEFVKTDDGIAANVVYNTDLYDEWRVERLISHFQNLLQEIINNPAKTVDEINYLKEAEEDQINAFNQTNKIFEGVQTIKDLFEEQAEKTPFQTALEFENARITYKTLNEKANRLATYLKEEYNLSETDTVGVLMDNSPELIISTLAIIKSGATFVPLNINYPENRVKTLADDAKFKVILSHKEIAFEGLNSIKWEEVVEKLYEYSPANHPTNQNLNRTAYIIYTSGSTGIPKGVEIAERSFVNYINWANDYYFSQKQHQTGILFTPFSSDLTLTSIFCTLLRGDLLAIFSQRNVSEALAYAFDVESNVNFIKMTPSHINILELLEIPKTLVEQVIVGGEELTTKQVGILKNLNPKIQIYNEYGPTEATVGCTIKEVKNTNEMISIGVPVANTQIYILDNANNKVPIGVIGEICVAGLGVSKGYFKNPIQTNEKFIVLPQNGIRIYKTGDLGKWTKQGEIEYLGRKDNQVKVRGFRVELGEIEQAIQKYEGVSQNVVLQRSDADSKYLVAYIVGISQEDTPKLRHFLQNQLPDYMIPVHFVSISEMPLTSVGKVDKTKLPDISGIVQYRNHVAPRNEVETKLVEIWEQVLHTQNIGIEDNFFEVGGDSLKIIHLFKAINKEFEGKISVVDLFKYNSIRALSDQIFVSEPQNELSIEMIEV